MSIKKQQIRNALAHVIHPNLGKDLVTLDYIRDIIVQEKYVTFTVELAEEAPKIESKLKELCRDTIHRYVDDELVLDIQTRVNTFRQKEVENREVQNRDVHAFENGPNPMNMDGPNSDNYTPPSTVDPVPSEEMPGILQRYVDEHEECLEEIDSFEKALIQFKKNKWVMDEKINKAFSRFFTFMDNTVLAHNRDEEEKLFPLLKQRLLESGEHSQQENKYISDEEPRNAVEVMEDEHVKFIQFSTLIFNFLGLAHRLPDIRSQSIVSDLVFEQGVQLIEALRLHIQRENRTLFPLACSLISDQEFEDMEGDKAVHQN
ncbi:iron-sulfur cluster assembly protein [Aliifodinibius sp. S!AR15-10]|uniref:iron-sulfur cluster assembly protein n=1 Tax=Aliifodinibius sp. S!AR15-10 TaxID=2950437 RepID=UPI00285518F5|nr:iron-sulfur cluster assembly protein [Aliifodinibius sp. S!AR15-10]MDR8390749.1 iron-sulfur cluster assembly protein [Aliifodinibius sp. S!AR15-10]